MGKVGEDCYPKGVRGMGTQKHLPLCKIPGGKRGMENSEDAEFVVSCDDSEIYQHCD